MSYNLSVYATSRALPSMQYLRDDLRQVGLEIDPEAEQAVSTLDGHLPIIASDGREVGFEVYIGDVVNERRFYREGIKDGPEPEDVDYFDALETSDIKILLVCHDERAVAAGRRFATTLAGAARGYFSDPQQGTFRRVVEGE